MPACQTLVAAAVVITQNEHREILHDAGIAINDGKIAAIGALADIEREWQAQKRIHLGQMLVMPGLINAHTHAAMTFLRGFADDLPLMDWLGKAVFPVEARLNQEIVELGAMLGFAEMLATGTTGCVDMYIHEEAVLRAAEKSGIRCLGGEGAFGFPSAACPDWRAALAATAHLAGQYRGHTRIQVAVCPHSVYTTTAHILTACRDLALDLNLPIHIHLAETREETDRCLAAHGARPVAHIAELGLLDARVIAAHLVDLKPSEAALLARRGACGVHNPSSNMKLASGAAPVTATLKAGLPLALGCDGPASNNQLNMFAEMRQTALLHKLVDGEPASMPAGAVLDMATRGGGMALGIPALGSLRPGAPADIIALDLRPPNMRPLHNPVSQAVYAASGHECRFAMVEGEVLYKDGKYTRFDYDALLAESEKLRAFALDNQ